MDKIEILFIIVIIYFAKANCNGIDFSQRECKIIYIHSSKCCDPYEQTCYDPNNMQCPVLTPKCFEFMNPIPATPKNPNGYPKSQNCSTPNNQEKYSVIEEYLIVIYKVHFGLDVLGFVLFLNHLIKYYTAMDMIKCLFKSLFGIYMWILCCLCCFWGGNNANLGPDNTPLPDGA